jgi:hypothetical protein
VERVGKLLNCSIAASDGASNIEGMQEMDSHGDDGKHIMSPPRDLHSLALPCGKRPRGGL